MTRMQVVARRVWAALRRRARGALGYVRRGPQWRGAGLRGMAVWGSLGVLVGVAACGGGGSFEQRFDRSPFAGHPDAGVVLDRPAQPAVELVRPTCVGPVPGPPMVVPRDFVPSAAVVCGDVDRGNPRERPGAPYTRTVYRGEMDAVVRAFTTVNPRGAVSAGTDDVVADTCSSDVVRVGVGSLPEVWLVEDSGLGLRVAYPDDGCAESPHSVSVDGLREVMRLRVADRVTMS
ncbi:hypothetical protein [Gordonia sputi]|uniref:hypothetical protein n=1 Tax=Gordonia sputi TaxID=36823 RepID=UPI00226D4029|nr:hypothetical protein [Gordonia sputi]